MGVHVLSSPTVIGVSIRRALFWAACKLYLAGKVKELRGTVGCVRVERMVVFYSLSLLCWLRLENFLQFRESLLNHYFVPSGFSTVTE